jgi:hypothetical protein
MSLPVYRSEVGASGPVPCYPVRERGRVVGFAPREVARAPGNHGRARPVGGAPLVLRSPSGGGLGRTSATTPAAGRGRVHALPALSRSAPTVLSAADLRAIIAGRRSLPGDQEEPLPRRSYQPRQQVVNITYTVRQEVAPPPVTAASAPAAAEALGAQMADTAARIRAAAAGVEEANPLFTFWPSCERRLSAARR